MLSPQTDSPWWVYIIECDDGSLYTGISNDVGRRLGQHATLKGARYFRGRSPKTLVYVEGGHDRSSASKREAAIKKLRRAAKQRLIASEENQLSESGINPTPLNHTESK